MAYSSVNAFRKRRGVLLRTMIADLAQRYGRAISILDVGGREDYWHNIGLENIAEIVVLNYSESELKHVYSAQLPVKAARKRSSDTSTLIGFADQSADFHHATSVEGNASVFRKQIGDARNLSDFADQSVDLVHSNSVIEHVGAWRDMRAMAEEVVRVGRAGWVQTPAWSFPIEPHFRAPVMHWFGRPLQARLMSLSFDRNIRALPLDRRRRRIDNINLLAKREVAELFPGKTILTERVLFAKSYTVTWASVGTPSPAAPV